MKPYKEVVKERYDRDEKESHLYENIYSMINPIGFNADRKIRSVFYTAFNYMRRNGVDISKALVLDIGCGKGATTRFFSELIGNAQHIYGLDLSEYRIKCAAEINPKINYKTGDIVSPFPFSTTFDVITALDVFMHLNNKEEIISALDNIKKNLKDEGYFIWYDVYAPDHFKTTKTQDHSGFHPRQMISLAEKAGFKKVLQINVFKKLLWKYHSLYLNKRMPEFIVHLIEKIIPGSPGNMMLMFIKSK